jgi:hypothetical protein
MFFDWFHIYRTIWTDGRALRSRRRRAGHGNSVGKWEGDTFVVRSGNFDDRSWLDADGHPHTEDMKLEERLTCTDRDTLQLTMTVTDPKAHTRRGRARSSRSRGRKRRRRCARTFVCRRSSRNTKK